MSNYKNHVPDWLPRTARLVKTKKRAKKLRFKSQYVVHRGKRDLLAKSFEHDNIRKHAKLRCEILQYLTAPSCKLWTTNPEKNSENDQNQPKPMTNADQAAHSIAKERWIKATHQVKTLNLFSSFLQELVDTAKLDQIPASSFHDYDKILRPLHPSEQARTLELEHIDRVTKLIPDKCRLLSHFKAFEQKSVQFESLDHLVLGLYL